MTINGPAPIILAFFMNAAIDQQVEQHLQRDRRGWEAAQRSSTTTSATGRARLRGRAAGRQRRPRARAARRHRATWWSSRDVYERIKAETLRTVRGTVQADILKEDQAQNTCIFSTEFALRMMGDIQQYFVDQRGAQLLLRLDQRLPHRRGRREPDLASSRSRWPTASRSSSTTWRAGWTIDDFAPNLSFFFSNGMDPEYAVIGRVARRIWARAMRERYGASPRSQMLKYHIQTSGR